MTNIHGKIQDYAIKCVFLYFEINFLKPKFLCLVQFPSFCEISDQINKMPRNEGKNKIILGPTTLKTDERSYIFSSDPKKLNTF